MIARTWHGAVPIAKAGAYHEFLRGIAVKDYRSTPGNRGVYVLRRDEGALSHFLLISLWDSIESIRSFAGPETDKACYYPEDASFLVEMEPHATHYEVLLKEGETLG